jgi:hypothetical protein
MRRRKQTDEMKLAMAQGCLSLDMAFVICKQLAEPLYDMFFKDYESEWKKRIQKK